MSWNILKSSKETKTYNPSIFLIIQMHSCFHAQTNLFFKAHFLFVFSSCRWHFSVHCMNMALSSPLSQPESQGGQATQGNSEWWVRSWTIYWVFKATRSQGNSGCLRWAVTHGGVVPVVTDQWKWTFILCAIKNTSVILFLSSLSLSL